MKYLLRIPARINMLGNGLDACEPDLYTLTSAVRLYAWCIIEPSDEYRLRYLSDGKTKSVINECKISDEQDLQILGDDPFKLMKAPILRLIKESKEFSDKFWHQPMTLSLWTDVPRQSGLGGSSLLMLNTFAALRAFYNLCRHKHNDYFLSEMTQRTEEHQLGIYCGYADRYIPLFGGLAYVDYRGKYFHKDYKKEPLPTYERLEKYVPTLPLLVISSGVEHHSGDVHSVMKAKYEEEFAQIRNGNSKDSFMVSKFAEMGDCVWQGKIALLENDWQTFGKLLEKNQSLINEVMKYCGFTEGAGSANEFLIEAAKKSGALGAKLTGAGGGGSVFALTEPGREDILAEQVLELAHSNGLTKATTYKCDIDPDGCVVQKID